MNELSIRDSFSTRMLKRNLGLIVAMAVACVLLGWIFLRGRSDWPERLALAGQILSGIMIAYLLYQIARLYFGQKRWVQISLLELKPEEKDRSRTQFLISSYAFIGVIQLLISLILGGAILQALLGTMFLLHAIFTAMISGANYLVCPQGIWNYEMTRWEEIERYEWENDDLWVRRKKSFLRLSEFCLAIDESQKDEVDQILREKVGEVEE